MFRMQAPFTPSGDQPHAIDSLVRGIQAGHSVQVLLGVTGSGKTYTMAKVIEHLQRPALVIAHNKTLAAQLCSEFRAFFPDSAVEYFVSYYDYYQPEAYIPSSDTFIDKESTINDEIDRLRHSATSALRERRDCIIVASVSCIYALGAPEDYYAQSISLRVGMRVEPEVVLRRLIDIQYLRNDVDFVRGTFRLRGDVLEIIPVSYDSRSVRVEFFDDEIERISEVNTTTGEVLVQLQHAAIFPASHYVTDPEHMKRSLVNIEDDLHSQAAGFESQGKLLEQQRILQRTRYDLEMMREIGYCTGVENYSRYFDGRAPGQAPFTLLDYLPKDYLMFIDESHVTVPQIRGMYAGDRARKENLVGYGFRLPSAFDNRPLRMDEFEPRMGQTVFVSATPAAYEMDKSEQVVEQIIRPTGLVDPQILVRPAEGQVDDLLREIREVTAQGNRVLVTTLTKKMSENLTTYLAEAGVRVRYLHSEIDTLDRMKILRDLRLGEFDVLVGINLLREGLDLPEVSLVAILDADKQGFLRSTTSLVQTIGRAARNVEGRVIMYAGAVTEAMDTAIRETTRRREIQTAYNEAHGIVPQNIQKQVRAVLEISGADPDTKAREKQLVAEDIASVEGAMRLAAQALDFEEAARLRDLLFALQAKHAGEPQPKGSKGRGRRKPS